MDFGGYTQQNFSGKGFQTDPNAFLFSLINQENTKIIMKSYNPQYAICAKSEFGPSFSQDIYICKNSNTNNESHSNLGLNYKHPNYACNSDEARMFRLFRLFWFYWLISVSYNRNRSLHERIKLNSEFILFIKYTISFSIIFLLCILVKIFVFEI
jgi:hypothetical protein